MSAREDGKRIGGVTFLPLAEEVIRALIDENIREQSIESWAIRKWSETNLTVYIPSISIHHTGNKQQDRERGHFTIRSAIRWAFTLDRQCDIKKWYAIAATPEGRKLVQHLGFGKVEGKRDAYMLTDLKRARQPIKSFLELLEHEEHALIPPPRKQPRGRGATGSEAPSEAIWRSGTGRISVLNDCVAGIATVIKRGCGAHCSAVLHIRYVL